MMSEQDEMFSQHYAAFLQLANVVFDKPIDQERILKSTMLFPDHVIHLLENFVKYQQAVVDVDLLAIYDAEEDPKFASRDTRDVQRFLQQAIMLKEMWEDLVEKYGGLQEIASRALRYNYP